MASNINPNNIDTAYPIAGQDNDSQGFRDNFTNMQTNFEYSKEEIQDLQDNVLLKNALQGGDPANDQNNLDGTKLTAALMVDMREFVSSNTSPDVNASTGYYHVVTVVDGMTLSFNFPKDSDSFSKVRVDLTVGTASDVVFPIGVVGFLQLENISAENTLTLPAGRFIYEFFTINGGDEIIVTPIVQAPTP